MANYRMLSEAEWRAHPMNRVRGWIGAAVLLTCASFAVARVEPLAALRLQASDPYHGTTLEDLDFPWTLIGTFHSIAALVFLWAIWTRWKWTPEFNAITSATFIAVYGVGEFLYPTEFGEFYATWMAFNVSEALVVIGFAIHLIIGPRSNVMFRRRERVR